MSSDDRNVTLRRTIEQAIHCLEEAASVLGNGEDPRCAEDDALHAKELIRIVIAPGIRKIVESKR